MSPAALGKPIREAGAVLATGPPTGRHHRFTDARPPSLPVPVHASGCEHRRGGPTLSCFPRQIWSTARRSEPLRTSIIHSFRACQCPWRFVPRRVYDLSELSWAGLYRGNVQLAGCPVNSRFLGTQPQTSTDLHNCIKGACPVDKPLDGSVTLLRPRLGWREIREHFQFFIKSAAPTLPDSLPSSVRRPHRERPVPRPALRWPRTQAQERSGVAAERLSASRMFLRTPASREAGLASSRCKPAVRGAARQVHTSNRSCHRRQ